ncbi:hypothetical protein BDP27DRAFT_1273933 [Rhodocollybia butyracea]|uniref:VTT domain-containing protein n=1 Tax=Rhodocollybia butyracea TaxID=206335 RepID=A0A9P5PAW2_9AGAR|nr:hypothetical protein BDP27DRAFT_1436481 [Rhodocollybia butyracea]KAF9059427.1 hypothetical protein BDP27DRAFT_1273933 [Rhodocollybia butyracea]
MPPAHLNLSRDNSSVYTLATVNNDDESVNSPRAPLLTPLTPSYGSTMPRSPGTRTSSKKLILNATLKMAAIFIVSTALLGGTLWLALPTLEESDRPMLRIPKSFQQLQELNGLLKKYRDIYPYRIVICYITTYLFLQAFSLPGSMYLSILGGAVWGVARALPLACCCVASGATLCYLISSALGPALLTIPRIRTHLESMADRVHRNRENLISYLIVLRIAPLPPHWVVNVVAPHVGIGIPTFWISTALGIFGVSVIHTTIGGGLDEMTSADDFHLISWRNFFGLAAIVVGVMIPVGLRYWFKRGGVTADIEEDAESQDRATTALPPTPRTATLADGTTVFLYDEDEEDDDEEQDRILAVGAPARVANKAKDVGSHTALLSPENEDDEEYTSDDDDGDIILEAGPSLHDTDLKSPKPIDLTGGSGTSRES